MSGFDSRETPREDPSVWVVRSAGQYARVNTETAEIDTVRQVEGPSGVVQSGGLGLLLTQGDGRAWTIDPAAPQDIREQGQSDDRDGAGVDEAGADEAGSDEAAVDEAADEASTTPDGEQADGGSGAGSASEASGTAAIRTPGGTREVTAGGGAVLFHTESGEAHLGGVAHSAGRAELGGVVRLDPYAEQNAEAESEDERREYRTDAAAIDADGLVALYSQAERTIRWFESSTGQFRRGASEVPEEVPAEGVQLAIIGGEWALLDATGGRLWREDGTAADVELVGSALLQGSSTGGSDTPVLIADEAGLWAVGDGVERVSTAEGVPARPEQVGDDLVAAWIGSTSAALWTRSGGDTVLELDEAVEDSADPTPAVRVSGDRALVTDMRSGMMWTVPDGRLIPVEQWSLVDPPKQETGTVVTQDVTEQEPPVAVDDSFGVRAGEPAPLPVLLNDYDPNRKDVLTVVTDGLGEGLPPEFGTVEALSDGQGFTVHPTGSASGSASFTYRITDGATVSQPATVTLTVVPDSVNTAPQWCPVDGCQRTWPAPELAPGGTLVLPVIEGWVDPEGDPMMVAGAVPADSADPVRALVTADGRLAVRHTDPNAPDGDIAVRVSVTDSRGETTDRELRIRVRPGAAAEFTPIAATVKTGEPTVLRPLERVTGGSGSFVLVDAVLQSGGARVAVNQSAGTIEVTAAEAGGSLISATVRDTATDLEVSGVIRITAVEQRSALAVPPLRAFVRPLGDTTVDVLDAIPGANSRSLVVQSASVVDGELRADVIEHARIRLSGSTPDGLPGRIGSADIVLAEGDLTARGRITVFQVPETTGTGAIAVADAVTVRAGSVVNIPVLENDVAPPGERLVLHPDIGAPGVEGELAFASGSQVRYLAPSAPGTYTLSYTTYGASSPEMSDVGQVRVTVQAAGANRDPQPHNVTVRVAPGESVNATIPVTR
ncbi:Ig-like domain-containing protein, partial [Mycolicibacterium sp.]|uniref:Ig-like domain-containing protein n=1 Tax=Mycolicibacterium sp. TaxID=2320850 RepID=UPI003560D966